MTLHFHGTPITPLPAMAELAGRCFCVSFARPDQVRQAHALGQAVMLDNGAFSVWRKGILPDWPGYYHWCGRWLEHQTTWAVIPDVIEGTERENDRLVDEWPHGDRGAPVWHMHESLERLQRLAGAWPLICIGSSGMYAALETPRWHRRMEQAMAVLCPDGLPTTRIHMLRGMAQAGGRYPFYSLDSTDIAQNHNRPQNTPRRMAERRDAMQCPPRWTPPCQQESFDLDVVTSAAMATTP